MSAKPIVPNVAMCPKRVTELARSCLGQCQHVHMSAHMGGELAIFARTLTRQENEETWQLVFSTGEGYGTCQGYVTCHATWQATHTSILPSGFLRPVWVYSRGTNQYVVAKRAPDGSMLRATLTFVPSGRPHRKRAPSKSGHVTMAERASENACPRDILTLWRGSPSQLKSERFRHVCSSRRVT